VRVYRNAEDKSQKREMERLISEIKSSFRQTLQGDNPLKKRLRGLETDLYSLENQILLFEESPKEKKARERKISQLRNEIDKLRPQLEEIESGKIYHNAFEWRFEFPEVLDDKGNFIGFDVIIGNPPYGVKFKEMEKRLYKEFYTTIDDIYTIFMEKATRISHKSGFFSFITPISWLTGDKYYSTRKIIYENSHLVLGITLPYDIFNDAYVDTGIYLLSKNKSLNMSLVYEFNPRDKIDFNIINSLDYHILSKKEWSNSQDLKLIFNPLSKLLNNKLSKIQTTIEDITDSARGILANKNDYSLNKIDDFHEPILTGKLDRYFLEDVNEYIKYGDNLREKPSSFDFFTGERILVRRIISRQFRIMATLTQKPLVVKKDIYIFKLNTDRFSIKYLLSIINSKFVSYLKTKNSTSAKKDDFTQLTMNDIRKLRIPIPTPNQVVNIENIVDQILTAKKSNPKADTSELEKEINQIVYELYGLSEEEIRIIEGEIK
jgi:adenine-specific DNA-methyltransferase